MCGPSAGTYLRLAGGFTAKGANIGQEGVKQIGTFEGIPVFKAPASIIPTDEMLTVYKNVNNESDIGIAFGTLIPFFSTGIIQRKNFYKEAGLDFTRSSKSHLIAGKSKSDCLDNQQRSSIKTNLSKGKGPTICGPFFRIY
mgnify:FL=1